MFKYACLVELAYFSLPTPAVCDLCDIPSYYRDKQFKERNIASTRRTPRPPSVSPAMYCDHRHQSATRFSMPNRAETAHAKIANSQSRSKTKAQAHKTASTLQTVQQKTRYYATRQKTGNLSSSRTSTAPAAAGIASNLNLIIAVKRLAKTAACQLQRLCTGTLLQ